MYPNLADDGQPQDKITQVRAALAKLKGGQGSQAAQRERMVYELWTLSELAADPDCREEFLRLEGVSVVLAYLSEGNSLGESPQAFLLTVLVRDCLLLAPG